MNQTPFFPDMGADSFADNPEPRCPCVLLLDVSTSMAGRAIEQLNEGINVFQRELQTDSLAIKRVEICVITFGPVKVECTFRNASTFTPPLLRVQGNTPMGEAICKALELVRVRKEEYRQNGIAFYRPWVFLITDGAPTDNWRQAASLIRQGEKDKAFAFFAVGVQSADMKILQELSVRDPLKLDGLKFRELFQWLSNSMRSVSCSVPGASIALESPSGWAEL